uniref:hypothetical protein n=1 Tax=Timspurckia oligopyrenoides TaxID=708627 RepID=UPI001FCD1487|nr:hypothetical protein MW591_pgp051 [Timspurckia oligopyrenoides]UNJ17564.1 hypothetical protein [Timspurckia oligopyrenoides]
MLEVNVLPVFIKKPLDEHPLKESLIEVIMDLGRRPEARFPNKPVYLSSKTVDWIDLDHCVNQLSNFSGDNRAGIERTLHRISSVRNREGKIIGLTCRVGRAVFGTINIIRDLLETQQSILLLGKPGVGKTTAIREIARILADEMDKRVVIIDTSNEIAGDGDIAHRSIGRARRMQVSKPELQHHVMIEAVENHMPEVIIIDEIGTELETFAARTIAERGVQLVGTAHGNYLESLIKNPTLSDLVGGVQYVTLGDEEAKRRGTQKSILERKTSPAFTIAIEIHERYCWIVHENVQNAVDQILNDTEPTVQVRRFNPVGKTIIQNYNAIDIQIDLNASANQSMANCLLVNRDRERTDLNAKSIISIDRHYCYLFALNYQKIEKTIEYFELPFVLTRRLENASIILAIRSQIRNNHILMRIAQKKLLVCTVNSNSTRSLYRGIRFILKIYKHKSEYDKIYNLTLHEDFSNELEALEETRIAIEKIVLTLKTPAELMPRGESLRVIQSDLIRSYSLTLQQAGEEPYRRIRIYPG